VLAAAISGMSMCFLCRNIIHGWDKEFVRNKTERLVRSWRNAGAFHNTERNQSHCNSHCLWTVYLLTVWTSQIFTFLIPFKNVSFIWWYDVNITSNLHTISIRVFIYLDVHISGDVLYYKSEGRWFDPSWCQWIFHWHKFLPIILLSRDRLRL